MKASFLFDCVYQLRIYHDNNETLNNLTEGHFAELLEIGVR
ncbi:MAG: hypothetical protein BAJATHORv1_30176 [Candidatus Thorarchaeota archaeon]|nr:MAG: hypothetical protein BAJATHORv1_30176 [Candidatus Thorarchaeota archaeon]